MCRNKKTKTKKKQKKKIEHANGKCFTEFPKRFLIFL